VLSIDQIHIARFKDIWPGDCLMAYRNDWCIGHVLALSNGNFRWHFTPAIWGETGESDSFDGAAYALLQSFDAWAERQGIEVVGPSREPAEKPDWAKHILDGLKMEATSTSARAYMNDRRTQRLLKEIEPEARGRLALDCRRYIRQLQEAENAEEADQVA
jgi:hypothetical protein